MQTSSSSECAPWKAEDATVSNEGHPLHHLCESCRQLAATWIALFTAEALLPMPPHHWRSRVQCTAQELFAKSRSCHLCAMIVHLLQKEIVPDKTPSLNNLCFLDFQVDQDELKRRRWHTRDGITIETTACLANEPSSPDNLSQGKLHILPYDCEFV